MIFKLEKNFIENKKIKIRDFNLQLNKYWIIKLKKHKF
jgi:hypothetical protein